MKYLVMPSDYVQMLLLNMSAHDDETAALAEARARAVADQGRSISVFALLVEVSTAAPVKQELPVTVTQHSELKP